MLNYLKNKIVGSFSDREIKKYKPMLQKINSLEESIKGLSHDQCLAKVEELKTKAQSGTS